MNTVDQLRNDISTLVTFSEACGRENARRRDEIASALAPKRQELRALSAERASRLTPPIFKDVAPVRSLWERLVRPAIGKIDGRRATLETAIAKMVSDGRSAEQARKMMGSVSARLRKTETQIRDLDQATEEIAEKLHSASEAVARLAKRRDQKGIVDAARMIVVLVDAWWKAGRMSRSGQGTEVAGRIWLPIPTSMAYQAKSLGAKHDPAVKNASPFFVDIDEPLARFDSLLPHSFRQNKPRLRFSSIRENAQRQNIWSFMDPLSWDHIRNVNYSMTGRRCILCGKQSAGLVRKLEPGKPNKVGTVECHEVWNWTRPDPDIPVGIQTLERIMVVCFDCHMCFHDEIARGKAFSLGEEGLEKQVQGYLIKRRCNLTGTSPKDVVIEMAAERAALAGHKGVTNWIVDLTNLAKQDYMYGQTPTLVSGNPAGVKAGQIAGIRFRTEDGAVHPSVNPERLYQDVAMKWITQPEPTYQLLGSRR